MQISRPTEVVPSRITHCLDGFGLRYTKISGDVPSRQIAVGSVAFRECGSSAGGGGGFGGDGGAGGGSGGGGGGFPQVSLQLYSRNSPRGKTREMSWHVGPKHL
jgi:hypothetical protein